MLLKLLNDSEDIINMNKNDVFSLGITILELSGQDIQGLNYAENNLK